jgi:hypothetical protein
MKKLSKKLLCLLTKPQPYQRRASAMTVSATAEIMTLRSRGRKIIGWKSWFDYVFPECRNLAP